MSKLVAYLMLYIICKRIVSKVFFLIILKADIVKRFQIFLSNTKNSIYYCSFYFRAVRWFQVLLFNINNLMYQVFLSNTNNLHKSVCFKTTIIIILSK